MDRDQTGNTNACECAETRSAGFRFLVGDRALPE
jgi:hypothetical protein